MDTLRSPMNPLLYIVDGFVGCESGVRLLRRSVALHQDFVRDFLVLAPRYRLCPLAESRASPDVIAADLFPRVNVPSFLVIIVAP